MLQFIKTFDIYIVRYVSIHFQFSFLNEPMVYITKISEYGFIWMILICFLLASKKYRKIGIIAAFAFLLCRIEVQMIKPLIKRPRPFLELTNLKLYISKPTSYSFPSGHAISSFATIGVIIKMIDNIHYKIFFIVTALLVSFSRLYLLLHYPSDLLGGIILGLISSKIALSIFKKQALIK